MNYYKFSSILLISLLNWGSIASAVQPIQQFSARTLRPDGADNAASSTPLVSAGYVPPNYGLPLRKEGGGARWRQNRLPTQITPQRSLMGNNLRVS